MQPAKPARANKVATATTRDLQTLLDAVDRAGVNSVRKLKYFLMFADNEGRSMAELAGRAKSGEYNDIQQAVIELSTGRRGAKIAPELIRLGDRASDQPGHGRRKPILLTPKGRRLLKRLSAFRR